MRQTRGEETREKERERERVLFLFIFSCFCDADLTNVSERFLDKAFVDAPHELETLTTNCSKPILSDLSTSRNMFISTAINSSKPPPKKINIINLQDGFVGDL